MSEGVRYFLKNPWKKNLGKKNAAGVSDRSLGRFWDRIFVVISERIHVGTCTEKTGKVGV